MKNKTEYAPAPIHVTVGSGRTVHRAHEDNGLWLTCGADHATNRGMTQKKITLKDITCKKCLKQTSGNVPTQQTTKEHTMKNKTRSTKKAVTKEVGFFGGELTLETLLMRLEQLECDVEDLEGQVEDLECEVEDLEGQVETLEDEVSDVQDDVGTDDIESDIDNLDSRIGDLECDKEDDDDSRIETIEDNIRILEERLDEEHNEKWAESEVPLVGSASNSSRTTTPQFNSRIIKEIQRLLKQIK